VDIGARLAFAKGTTVVVHFKAIFAVDLAHGLGAAVAFASVAPVGVHLVPKFATHRRAWNQGTSAIASGTAIGIVFESIFAGHRLANLQRARLTFASWATIRVHLDSELAGHQWTYLQGTSARASGTPIGIVFESILAGHRLAG
jgi:hypothetical protein